MVIHAAGQEGPVFNSFVRKLLMEQQRPIDLNNPPAPPLQERSMSGAKRTTNSDRARIQKLVIEEKRTKADASRIVGFSRKTVIKICKQPREFVSRRFC